MSSRTLSPEKCARIRALVERYGRDAAARIAGVSPSTVTALRRRGYQPATLGRKPPPMPADFAIQVNYMTVDDLQAHYGVGRVTMRAWLASVKREYVAQRASPRKRPAPEREVLEAALQEHGGVMGACEALGVCRAIFQRWRKERGLPIDRPGCAPRRKETAPRRDRVAA
ncbi:hypothetical protein [Rhizorhabdus sp.]|uniref:hypothetical protein n=1 Tax=Rhizorhabdus sp. TaxID=1968843 RepID=UPI0019CAE47A|nr:hypothetical protein [Rhizorhabdus sp.]MBD3762623.1 hypothetical protein [Rhizorhabdus sp.]